MRWIALFCLATAALAQEPKNWTAAEDHQNMMDQLGIKALRPGPSGNEQAPNHANYDESKANPFPNLPDVLTLKNGTKVTSAEMWRNQRRPEIVEDFSREVLGRVPKDVPKVTWTVEQTVHSKIGAWPVVGKRLVGHVDNSSFPAIDVNIQMQVVVPEGARGPVPLMMMFGGRGLPELTPPPPPGGRGFPNFPQPPGPSSTEQMIRDGWGFAAIAPNSIQADNGAGLTKGVIGLVNHGQPRKPDDWGSLRAWAWGASRGLDYLETDAAVDAKHVGIEGVSRYGKAALVTMAFDERFAVVLVGSSGEGGAKLHRRNWGEAVENLTGTGEYHWMAGNFLKYGASEATFGSKNAGDLPVDAHELIALCAPRPTFISYGVPEKGDAKWLDHQGSYMATVAAGPVFRLLGVKDLGVGDDYHTLKMPAVNVGLLDGTLAWRQHDGGHTDGPNWTWFLAWADRQFHRTPPPDRPMARTDRNSQIAHEQLLAKAKAGGTDVYFQGDSITRRWGATDYPQFLANWKQNFFGWNAGDFGWGADMTQNMLWRVQNGEMDGVSPKVMVLLGGTNNIGGGASAGDVAGGIEEIVREMQAKAPQATMILTAVFPRYDRPQYGAKIGEVNAALAKWAEGKPRLRWLDVNAKMTAEMLNPDRLHPNAKGYQVWADGLKPILTELLGPPAKEDHAPAATGDPSAKR